MMIQISHLQIQFQNNGQPTLAPIAAFLILMVSSNVAIKAAPNGSAITGEKMDLPHILFFIWLNLNTIKSVPIHRDSLEISPLNALYVETPIFLF